MDGHAAHVNGAQRFILVKLIEQHANKLGRLRIGQRIKEQLAASQGIEYLEVLGPANHAAQSSWDLAIVFYGRTATMLDEALAHPQVKDVLEELSLKSECVKGWTFQDLSAISTEP